MTSPNLPPGTETCGCCSGIEASTPLDLLNRPGLSAIAYRIGTYAQFRASLIAGLSSAAEWRDPHLTDAESKALAEQLAKLLTRDAADFTIGLLDAFSCAADVLTFYQERLANESYLRTATERVSLQEMAKLIGYRLRPGVAAETWLAFALETPKQAPAELAPEPGAFVTGIPTTVKLAVGTKVQSVPGPDEKPQIFETVEAIDVRPEWNAMSAVTSVDVVPGHGATETWLNGVDANLKPGDWLLLVGAEFAADAHSQRWDARVLTAVETDPKRNRTRLAWREPLANVNPLADPAEAPTLYALRQRASAFGHNAPSWTAMSDEFKTAYQGSGPPFPGEWPDFDIHATPSATSGTLSTGALAGSSVAVSGVAAAAAPAISGVGSGALGSLGALVTSGGLTAVVVTRVQLPVSLDNSYPKIVEPGFALLVTPGLSELFRITEVTEISRAQFAISGKSTCIALSGDDLGRFSNRVRDLSILVQSEPLRRGRAPKTAAVDGAVIDVAADASGLATGRRLVVKGLRHEGGAPLVHEAVLVSAVAGFGGETVLSIDPPLPSALARDTVVVFGNVALATHGETGSQILGAGDASRAFQRFELKRTPLTYRGAANEIGADSALSVRIGDVEWSERSSMFGSRPTERAYTLSTDENDKLWVVFGDGERGARLPSGVNNVRASYRQGLGQSGNVAAEKLTQLMTRPQGLKSVANPTAASGGTDPEPADQARRSMPLGTRTLGRAVSLLDYEDFALAFSGVAKAQARVLSLPAGPTIAITLAGQDGAPLPPGSPVLEHLLAALLTSGDPHVSVQLLSYQASNFRLGLKVKRDPAYDGPAMLAAVEATLRAHFSFDERDLGQPVLQSDVVATVHSVPGVVAVDLDFLFGGTNPWAQTRRSRQVRLLATRMHVSGGVARPAELLTLDPGRLVRLEEMP